MEHQIPIVLPLKIILIGTGLIHLTTRFLLTNQKETKPIKITVQFLKTNQIEMEPIHLSIMFLKINLTTKKTVLKMPPLMLKILIQMQTEANQTILKVLKIKTIEQVLQIVQTDQTETTLQFLSINQIEMEQYKITFFKTVPMALTTRKDPAIPN